MFDSGCEFLGGILVILEASLEAYISKKSYPTRHIGQYHHALLNCTRTARFGFATRLLRPRRRYETTHNFAASTSDKNKFKFLAS